MIRYGAWQIGFFNHGARPSQQDLFGCSTMGAVTGRQFHSGINTGLFQWNQPVRGCVYAGNYREVLDGLVNCAFRPSFMLVFFARIEGSEEFLRALKAIMPDPSLAGGVAAPGADGAGELAPEAEDVAVLLTESAQFTANFDNPLAAHGGIYSFETDGPNVLKRLREPTGPWEEAAFTVDQLLTRYRVAPEDRQLLAFSDREGRNVRLRPMEHTGAMISDLHLPEEEFLHMRLSDRQTALSTMIEYGQQRQALTIADATFAQMIFHPFSVPEHSTMVFLSAQVAGGELSRLMLTSIRA